MIFFEHLLAILLGITVLPVKALLVELIRAFFAPLYFIYDAYSFLFPSRRSFLPIFLFFLTLPLHLAIVAVGAAFLFGFSLVRAYISIFVFAMLGLVIGLIEGMEGFLVGWDTITLDFRPFEDAVFVHQPVELNDLQAEPVEEAVPEAPVVAKIPEDNTPIPSNITLLTDAEIQKAEALLTQFSRAHPPLNENIINLLTTLKLRIERYKELSNHLLLVQQNFFAAPYAAAEVKNDDEIELPDLDELLCLETFDSTPVLLMEKYQNPKDHRWYCVPTSSRVTDKERFEHYLEKSNMHPLTGETIINSVRKYKEMPTQYFLRDLTPQCCNAPELVEGVSDIRRILRNLPDPNNLFDPVPPVPAVFYGWFFRRSPVVNRAPLELMPENAWEEQLPIL